MLVIKALAVRDTETQYSSEFLQHTLETVLKRIPSKKTVGFGNCHRQCFKHGKISGKIQQNGCFTRS